MFFSQRCAVFLRAPARHEISSRSDWRNRDEFFKGCEAIKAFLK